MSESTQWKSLEIEVGQAVRLDARLHKPSRIGTPKLPLSPTLIFLHFWGGSLETWMPCISNLNSEKQAVLVPSMRGWGASSKGLGNNSYRIEDYANDVAGIIRYLRESEPDILHPGIVLVGHSLGGKVAMLASTYSDVSVVLRGLVLVAPSPPGGFDFDAAMLERIRHAFDDFDTACQVLKTAMLGCVSREDESLVEGLAKDAIRADKDAVVAFADHGAASNFEAELIQGLKIRSSDLPRLKALVLEAAERPEHVKERVVEVLEKSGVETEYQMVECGHLIPVERPVELATLVQHFSGDC